MQEAIRTGRDLARDVLASTIEELGRVKIASKKRLNNG